MLLVDINDQFDGSHTKLTIRSGNALLPQLATAPCGVAEPKDAPNILIPNQKPETRNLQTTPGV
jgi:hypothetical protein